MLVFWGLLKFPYFRKLPFLQYVAAMSPGPKMVKQPHMEGLIGPRSYQRISTQLPGNFKVR